MSGLDSSELPLSVGVEFTSDELVSSVEVESVDWFSLVVSSVLD